MVYDEEARKRIRSVYYLASREAFARYKADHPDATEYHYAIRAAHAHPATREYVLSGYNSDSVQVGYDPKIPVGTICFLFYFDFDAHIWRGIKSTYDVVLKEDTMDYSGYGWIKVKKHKYDPNKSWEENYKALEEHHVQESTFLVEKVRELAMLRWRVMRQDDNGVAYEVDTGLDQATAEGMVKEMEARGHKQMYWVELVPLTQT